MSKVKPVNCLGLSYIIKVKPIKAIQDKLGSAILFLIGFCSWSQSQDQLSRPNNNIIEFKIVFLTTQKKSMLAKLETYINKLNIFFQN